MDLIDRQAALDELWKLRRAQQMMDATQAADLVMQGIFLAEKKIENLPSVQPEQRWTPVSEKQPEETGTYMTTIDYGEYGLVTGQRYYHGGVLGWNDECVIAWMPLPKPWKGE